MDNLSSNTDNKTNTTFDLEAQLGPKMQLDLYKVIILTVIYCLIFITGIFGNLCTCIVITRNKYMHTATNYYLFNLAISDLLVLILGLPQETYSFWSAYPWIFGETFCVLRIMAAETSTYASILTITSFTVERYVAIVHPMKAQTVAGLSRAVKVIVITWLLAAICSVPMVVQFGIVYQYNSKGEAVLESASCNIIPERYLKHTFEVSTFLFFLAPMTVITVLYILIGLAVRRSTLHRTGSDSSSKEDACSGGTDLRAQQQAKSRRAVLKMLVAVVVAFFICWAPFHTQRLLVIYNKIELSTPALVTFYQALFYLSGILYYVSSVINPILYNIMSVKFRRAFKNTLFHSCKNRNRKRSSFIAYKFCNGHLEVDSDLSVEQLKKNGYLVPTPAYKLRSSRSGSPHSNAAHKKNAVNNNGVVPFSSGKDDCKNKNEERYSLVEMPTGIKSTNFLATTVTGRPYHSFD